MLSVFEFFELGLDIIILTLIHAVKGKKLKINSSQEKSTVNKNTCTKSNVDRSESVSSPSAISLGMTSCGEEEMSPKPKSENLNNRRPSCMQNPNRRKFQKKAKAIALTKAIAKANQISPPLPYCSDSRKPFSRIASRGMISPPSYADSTQMLSNFERDLKFV